MPHAIARAGGAARITVRSMSAMPLKASEWGRQIVI